MRVPSWLGSGTRGRDLTLAGGSLVGGLVMYEVGFQAGLDWLPQLPRPWFLVPLVAVCGAVALRRVATRTGLVLGTAAFVADTALGGSVATAIIYTQVLYDSCVYGSPKLWRRLLRVTVVLTVLTPVVGVLVLWDWEALALGVVVALIGLLPVLTGTTVRQYRDRAVAERLRAEQTARLVELDRRQAVGAERSRMARELHDVVANHLSAVAIHATALLSVPGLDRAQVDSALRVIRENSVQGLAEMRQMIGLLREPAGDGDGPDSAEEPTQARLSELDVLVDRVRAAGLTVRTTVAGVPRPLPVTVDLAGYRIVQESLTNALKHGAGEAELEVTYQPGVVVVTVANRVRAGREAVPGAGAGLIGMRERVALLDGRFSAREEDGWWRIHAELPTTEAVA
ncbi:sensor histidine kinase [Micromonospora sp. SH-82]|uniref:sensor histidine kinase n=1 Tax=Micromonospora sp. SH-82 TaxID=3132938 RepID=UPI003EBAAF30